MWSFLVALVFLFPAFPLGHEFYNRDPEPHNEMVDQNNDDDMEIDVSDDQQDQFENGSDPSFDEEELFEEDDDDDDDDDNDDDDDETGRSTDHEDEIDFGVKWNLRLNRVVTHVESEDQGLTLVSTKQYGKSLVIDGHLQCCEKDEFVFHENLVHPALLAHNGPKTVFIMGGGSGSAAREVLKHKDIERVIICEIDRKVVKMCRKHMTANHEAFNDERLHIVYKDAKEELEESEEKFDVIIGDLNLPEIALSRELYRISFYENIVKTKLKDDGIFITQAGPAGMFTHMDIFSPIHCTLRRVFAYVVPYKAQVPSFGDVCGWVMASDSPITLNAEELDNKISERIRGELYYLDGAVIVASTVLDKIIKESLMEEIHVITENSLPLIRGTGLYSLHL